MMAVRLATAADEAALLGLAKELPQYFNEAGLAALEHDVKCRETGVAEEAGAIQGFLVLDVKSPSVGELLWMAVAPAHQNRGVGSHLLDVVLGDLRRRHIQLVEVKTLAASVDYPPYARTRRFWERHGFVLVEEIDPYPLWDPGNPCAIYVRAL